MEGTADAKTKGYKEHGFPGASPGSLIWPEAKGILGRGGWGQATERFDFGPRAGASPSGTSES